MSPTNKSSAKSIKQNPSSNVYLFYGEDDFSIRQKVDRWQQEFAKKHSASGLVQINGEELSFAEVAQQLNQACAPSLFSAKKLVVCKNCLPSKAGGEELAELICDLAQANNQDVFIVFYQTQKLDKRLSATKQILKSNANITEFNLPHGPAFTLWLKQQAKILDLDISDAAIEKLAVMLGRDLYEEKKFGGRVVERKEAFDLWQAHSELSKLASGGKRIEEADVQALVIPKISENVFNLFDSVLRNNKQASSRLAENLFLDQSVDEKTTAIKLAALLTEQFRALLLVASLKQKNLDNDQIADTLGWSSGRVFMVGKESGLPLDRVKDSLKRLLDIEIKLKTTDASGKLLIHKFIAEFASK